MLQLVLILPMVFLSSFLPAATLLDRADICLAPFTSQDPETLFKDDGLFFSIEDFKSCSQNFLNDWDDTPKEITELPFLTAMHGLRAILAVTRYDEKEAIVQALYGEHLPEKLEVMVEWLEEKILAAEQQYIRFLSSKVWNEEEEDFFIFTNGILLGIALVKGIPAILSTYTPDNKALHPARFKKTFSRADALETKVRYLVHTLARKQLSLFPDRREYIEASLREPKSPYYPEGSVHMIAGHIFRHILSKSTPFQMESVDLNDTVYEFSSGELPWTTRVKRFFQDLFRTSPSPYFYAYEEGR